jgi:hypothetical protein
MNININVNMNMNIFTRRVLPAAHGAKEGWVTVLLCWLYTLIPALLGIICINLIWFLKLSDIIALISLVK